ncbi:MAG TPA: heat-inducible transcription repressor HrcA [Ruminococcaceae bacterium]|nr:heat-inducible transcription repressor HrcA [Oscillospiraceae bacterium]
MEPAARKKQILSAIVESYISTGEPVGSKTLINEAGLKVSSATVRNDMADLTEQGYIIQPHTSAGRIPTQLGYRYYVDNSLKVQPVSPGGREYIIDELSNADSPEALLARAAKLSARLTDCVALATTPAGDESRVRKISFVPTGAHTAMAVVIVSNGIIKTKLFRCEFLITPEILGVFDKALNEVFAGVRLAAINRPFIQTVAAGFGELSLLMPSALMAVKEACDLAGELSVYSSGIGKLLGDARADRILAFLQNRHDLSAMLERLPLKTAAVIGKENSRVELASSSVISTRYQINGNPSGVLALIGPLRMDYARLLSVADCMGECVSELLNEMIDF